jgi:hypothetical protein
MSAGEIRVSSLRCRGCQGRVQVPDLEATDRARIAALVANGDRLQAMTEIRRLTGWDLREAKRLLLHLTTTRGRCHFEPCASELTSPVGICPICRRVNVDWLADP